MKPPYWDDARGALSRADPVMRRLIRRVPGVHLVRRGDPFTTLARAIVGQQISVKAAQTIWARFTAASGAAAGEKALDPARVARMRMPTLRRCGLSERKAEYLRDLARHFASGALDHTIRLRSAALAQNHGPFALLFGQHEIPMLDLARKDATFAHTTDTIGAFHIHVKTRFVQNLRGILV